VRRRPLRRPEAPPDPGTSRCDQGGTRLARNPRADLDRCLGEPRLERLSRTRRSDEPFASARRRGSLRGGDATPPWSTRRWSPLKGIAARPGEISGRYVTGHDRRMAPRERTMTIRHQAGRTCGEHFRSAWRHGILPASRRKGRARSDVPRNHTVGSCQPSFSNLYSFHITWGGWGSNPRPADYEKYAR